MLGSLGSLDLWGRREQRASAEAIDTIDHDRWLVAQIQGRPRLEKPPLPRWAIAATMALTGRRDEWAVRLPSALSGLATLALVYSLGMRIGGRSVALASALALCTSGLFISELRQAGNDGPLMLFTTLALHAAWRRLHDEPEPSGGRNWGLLMYAALGLGFLSKGPIVLLMVGLTLVPYLATVGRLGVGLRRFGDVRGGLLFLLLALCWPVPVLIQDPNALRVWLIEMGQKLGAVPIPHRGRTVLILEWPAMVLPWVVPGLVGIALPFIRQRRVELSDQGRSVWFPWWWVMGNLATFSCWAVAKPNYFVPCLPGMAILLGIAWVHLCRIARDPGEPRLALLARSLLQGQWVALFLMGILTPLVTRSFLPGSDSTWSVLIGAVFAAGVVLGVRAWRRGADALALAPLTAAVAFGVQIGYGVLAPTENTARSHRGLAARIERLVPRDLESLYFFHEIDEGLWFYLRSRQIVPVPRSQPGLLSSANQDEDSAIVSKRDRTPGEREARLIERQRQVLLRWLDRDDRRSSFLLIRDRLYDRFAADLVGRATPIYREQGVKRNGLVLLQAQGPRALAASPPSDAPTRR